MACAKVRYPSYQHAAKALIDARIRRALHGNRRRRELRQYFCPTCHSWHLTSTPAPNSGRGGDAQ